MEAGGIEPPSRDNSNGGLYMLSRCFNLDTGVGHRHSPPASSRLNLALWPTAESQGQPAILQPACRGHQTVLRLPVIRQPWLPGRQSQPGLQHHCWQLMFCSVIYEANERPRHATTTVAIRSKPVAPGGCLRVSFQNAKASFNTFQSIAGFFDVGKRRQCVTRRNGRKLWGGL